MMFSKQTFLATISVAVMASPFAMASTPSRGTKRASKLRGIQHRQLIPKDITAELFTIYGEEILCNHKRCHYRKFLLSEETDMSNVHEVCFSIRCNFPPGEYDWLRESNDCDKGISVFERCVDKSQYCSECQRLGLDDCPNCESESPSDMPIAAPPKESLPPTKTQKENSSFPPLVTKRPTAAPKSPPRATKRPTAAPEPEGNHHRRLSGDLSISDTTNYNPAPYACPAPTCKIACDYPRGCARVCDPGQPLELSEVTDVSFVHEVCVAKPRGSEDPIPARDCRELDYREALRVYKRCVRVDEYCEGCRLAGEDCPLCHDVLESPTEGPTRAERAPTAETAPAPPPKICLHIPCSLELAAAIPEASGCVDEEGQLVASAVAFNRCVPEDEHCDECQFFLGPEECSYCETKPPSSSPSGTRAPTQAPTRAPILISPTAETAPESTGKAGKAGKGTKSGKGKGNKSHKSSDKNRR